MTPRKKVRPFSRKFELDNAGNDREQGQIDSCCVQPGFRSILWSTLEGVEVIKEIDNPLTSRIHGDWPLERATFKFTLQDGQLIRK